MARNTIITLTDDLDGTSEADETVSFALDGRNYEIDLSTKHIEELRDALAPYVAAARRAGGEGGHGRKPGKGDGGKSGAKERLDKEEANAIREWVRAHGGTISNRGRIPQRYIDGYRAGDTSVIDTGDEDGDQGSDGAVTETVGAGAGDPFATFTSPDVHF